MKKNYFFTLLATLFFTAFSYGQVIFQDDFTYADGDLTASADWTAHSASGSVPIQVSSGMAVIAQGGGSREDVSRAFSSVTGDVYYAFDFIVNDLGSPVSGGDYEYFAHFKDDSFGFRARVDIIEPSGSGDFSIGLSPNTSTATNTWGTDLSFGQQYRVIVKYDQVTGVAQLWIDASDSSDTSISTAAVSPLSMENFSLRQAGSSVNETITVDNLVVGQTFDDVKEFPSAGSDPSIAFTAPGNNQVFPAGTTTVNVNFNIQNFTLSGDAGGGVSDNTGDGYIVGTAVENGMSDGSINIFSNSITYDELEDGDSVTLTAELVDNSGNSLNPAVTAMVTFSVDLPCDLVLGDIDTTCDALTPGADTYTATIDFTGGDTGPIYTITALDGDNNPVGTIGGDNPDMVGSGTITVSGIPEGTNVSFNVSGDNTSSCDIDRTLFSPNCFAVPFEERFDYTANTDLVANLLWQEGSSNTSNPIQVIANDDGGGNPVLTNFYNSNEFPDPEGAMITLSGSGSDPYIGFQDVTSGTLYASFLFQVQDFTGVNNDNGGYFAVLSEDNNFRARVWIRDVTADTTEEGLQYNIGIGLGSGATLHTSFTVNILEPIFIVIGYDLDNDEFKLWVAPDAATFGGNNPPSANVTLTDATSAGINRFLLRQDSTTETPEIVFDDLRVGTTWAYVTPPDATASVGENPIVGFGAFPNPVVNKQLTITSQSADAKQVVLYNILGKQVFSQNISGTRDTVELDALRSGLYILKVIEGSKISTSKLVIK